MMLAAERHAVQDAVRCPRCMWLSPNVKHVDITDFGISLIDDVHATFRNGRQTEPKLKVKVRISHTIQDLKNKCEQTTDTV